CGGPAAWAFATLDSRGRGGGGPAANYVVVVGPVPAPAAVDRPQFVVQVEPNRVVLDEFNRWAAPLGDAIARAVAGDLAALLESSRVSTSLLATVDPWYRVTIDVQQFESVPGKSV